MENPNKIVDQKEVVARMESEIRSNLFDLEQLLPDLGHSQSKRLLMAAMSYPLKEEDFSGESEALIRAFSLTKGIKDALVAVGVEVVIDQMLKAQFEQQQKVTIEEVQKEETNG